MQGQIRLERATEKNVSALFPIRYMSYLARYARYSDPSDPSLQSPEGFSSALREQDHFCVYYGTTLVGGAAMKQGEEGTEILELYIAPQHQRKGFGGAALRELERQYPSARFLMTVPGRETAGLFYQHGYKPSSGEGKRISNRLELVRWEKEAYKQVEVVLQPLRREALPSIHAWVQGMSQAERYAFSGGAFFELPSLDELGELFSFKRHRIGAARLDYAIEVPEYGATIGLVSLSSIEWEVRRCQVSHLAVAPAWRRVGIGSQSVQSVVDEAQDSYGIRGVAATVLKENEAAVRCFEEAGFGQALQKEAAFVDGDGNAFTRVVMVKGAGAQRDKE